MAHRIRGTDQRGQTATRGLRRCRYKGFAGMNRWVGLGVIADNIVNIGRATEKQATT
jgi:hypothetical protein